MTIPRQQISLPHCHPVSQWHSDAMVTKMASSLPSRRVQGYKLQCSAVGLMNKCQDMNFEPIITDLKTIAI